MKTVSLGTVISRTMQPVDLIPAFADELRRLSPRGRLPLAIYKDLRAYNSGGHDAVEHDFVEQDLLELLSNALNDYAPSYCYFGAHPCDGADFGFWLHEDFQELIRMDGGLEVADTSEVPSDYTGDVLHVNDHGNATLYRADNGKLTEIWSVV